MSEATVRLLQAAADVLGGQGRLAERLEIRESLLEAYIQDRLAIPDALLLRTVDILLSATPEPRPSPPRRVNR